MPVFLSGIPLPTLAAITSDDASGVQFMIALLLVLLAAWLGGAVATKMGWPAMLGELAVGILLGPPALGLLQPEVGLERLGEVGIFIMMLYIGTEIDPKDLVRASKPALLAAVGGFIVPLAGGGLYTYYYLRDSLPADSPYNPLIGALFVGMAVAVTSLAANSRILLDLKLLDSRIALVLMVGALVSDTAALVMFTGIMGFADSGTFEMAKLGVIASKALLFFILTGAGGIWLFPHVIPMLKRLGLGGKPGLFMVVLILALLYGELAHVLGLHGILGAFMAGIALKSAVPDRRMFHEITERLHVLVIGFLAPIFFVIAGFEFSFSVFKDDLAFVLVVFVIAVLAKIVGTLIFYLPSGNGWREGLTIGFGMNGRGAVEIIVAGIGYSMGLINTTVYSALVFMAIFTTAMVPSSLKWGVSWLQRRGELVRVRQREGAIIVGAGPLARFLAALLAKHGPVTIIDRNRQNCELAAAEGVRTVAGNVLDEGVMDDAGGLNAHTVLCLTPNPEINLLAAQYASEHFQVPVTVVLLDPDRRREMATMLEAGHHRVLWQHAFAHQEWDRRILGGQVHTEQVELADENAVSAFASAVTAPHILPVLLTRDGATRLVDADTVFAVGDVVQSLHTEPEAESTDMVTQLLQTCPVLDLPTQMDLTEFLRLAAAELGPSLDLDSDAFIRAFHEREGESGTVMGQGVAIPHIELSEPGRLELLVARCSGGVRFPPDDESVDTIFLLASSRDRRNDYLRALAAIAHIVQNKRFARQWQSVGSLRELRGALLAVDRIRST